MQGSLRPNHRCSLQGPLTLAGLQSSRKAQGYSLHHTFVHALPSTWNAPPILTFSIYVTLTFLSLRFQSQYCFLKKAFKAM